MPHKMCKTPEQMLRESAEALIVNGSRRMFRKFGGILKLRAHDAIRPLPHPPANRPETEPLAADVRGYL